MRDHFDAKDLRTLRTLHEYGFTDGELAEHLGLAPAVVRRMRQRLELQPNGIASGIGRDRRSARVAALLHPAQSHLGGHARTPGAVFLKLVDDRYFVEA